MIKPVLKSDISEIDDSRKVLGVTFLNSQLLLTIA